MQRVSMILGPLHSSLTKGNEEPDGYEGITSGGDYDRLLMTEWMMSSELPDEFMRRAVMNEHQFYKLRKQTPQASTITVALFDAGPLQLGQPRLIHLILLLLLHYRALKTNSTFIWGVLQHPDQGVRELKGEADIKHLLSGRTGHCFTEEMGDSWQEVLACYGEVSEFWVVGDESVSTLLGCCHQVFISELPEITGTKLQVGTRINARSRKIELALPDQNLLIRIMRNPFQVNRGVVSQSDRKLDNGNTLIFSDNGFEHLKYRGSVGDEICAVCAIYFQD